jgi:hypothetical protein
LNGVILTELNFSYGTLELNMLKCMEEDYVSKEERGGIT